jgi:Major capsid protein N-terminus
MTQDIYLSGNPQITFFKVVYRRHTNFAMESIEQTFNGAADFGKKVTCTISRNGDLIHRVYLRVELPDVKLKATSAFRWLNWVGHILVKSVEIEIGGQRIKLVSPEKYHAPVVCRAALEEKHLVVRARRTPIRPTRREGKATGASGRVSMKRRACNVFKLRETPESRRYQAMHESAWWPRLELGYGKNPPDAKDSSFTESLRWTIRSQAPGSSPKGDEGEKVQRLDGDGYSLQLQTG